ncbi:MAG: hypothetical protein NUV76_11825, partial [Candidatus Kuenenia sp.]|nr:hypothetical protein [Candidatus Kuenenia sp.]
PGGVKRGKYILLRMKEPFYLSIKEGIYLSAIAQTAINDAKTELNDLKQNHDIWKYYNFVVNQNETLLLKVIGNFELQIGNGAGYDEVRYEIRCKSVPDSQIEFIMDELGGWLQKNILEKIAARKLAVLSWEEYNQRFLVLYDRTRRRELIDFTLQEPPRDEDVQAHVKVRPRYIKQLEVIGTSDDEILEAVSDYLRADVNRQKWIDNEIIDEDIAMDFESRLKDYWKNRKKRIQITEKNLNPKEQGQVLYNDCSSRQEPIRDMNPPASTITGTYHALADKPVLGWHPNWENLFSNQKEE